MFDFTKSQDEGLDKKSFESVARTNKQNLFFSFREKVFTNVSTMFSLQLRLSFSQGCLRKNNLRNFVKEKKNFSHIKKLGDTFNLGYLLSNPISSELLNFRWVHLRSGVGKVRPSEKIFQFN